MLLMPADLNRGDERLDGARLSKRNTLRALSRGDVDSRVPADSRTAESRRTAARARLSRDSESGGPRTGAR